MALVCAADMMCAAGGLLPSVSSPKPELKSTERLQQASWTSASFSAQKEENSPLNHTR